MDTFIQAATERAQEIDEQRKDFELRTENRTEESEAPKRSASIKNEMDDELEAMLSKKKALIKVIGCGGGGNNTINRISEVGIEGTETIALNTDAQDLLYTTASKKILIGKESTQGLGAGSVPKIGEEAAREQESELKQSIQGADMVFITCGLGGGTGTGSAPVVADIAKKLGALTVGIVTLPFSMEGQRRYENAVVGLEKMESIVDTLIVIPNDKLLELAPNLPLHTAFKVADEILTNAVKGIAELVTKAGLVNLDFADIRAIMGNGGVALIGVGESDSGQRALEAVEKAVNNPLLSVDIAGATGALINVAGGSDMTLDEARQVVEAVSEQLDEDARVIWGAQISEDLQNSIRTMLIITGVKSSQIFGPARTTMDGKKKDIESALGIEFVN
ncbi:cell division protein FtsZ [Candidatus Woesearchaeota archaeon]|jgi:cell division protein FtsZ|nr:cell division protein FtsZ [Candidatus Woesearchaeota archaeon]MBT3537910.1 cell division protein FtsZ [Candidatus Woesearchaeota archaeon]MBT4698048.1 cell division protein FtsZ [Candidatus Woesearchaeota archaeon]MBT4716951.1 cell division protein FtsZ [Candidatus Woesearchaeota archaeon]MBT7105579.1 cell division protein FtsZ [Candidatus Woesearchaeota archaeon]